ncbi:hypothetical protein [Pseudogracilibacillus sp. SO30301A]|uniref:hypothetical protein n=1 Tax=Pseudogracilibacillus sp. SO30301A TaxID=3098291 RepID=UPI00300DF567
MQLKILQGVDIIRHFSPGDAPAAVTTFDGYPIGKAGYALSLSAFASLIMSKSRVWQF